MSSTGIEPGTLYQQSHVIISNMSMTRTMGERMERITGMLQVPIVQPSDTVSHDDRCQHCRTADQIRREAYSYIIHRLITSMAMNGNTDIKVRHKEVAIWPIRGSNVRKMNWRSGYEDEIDIYSHDHKCYTLLMGIRSIHKVKVHKELCRDMTVEIDIPYSKVLPIPVEQVSYRFAYSLANYLSNSCSKGKTVLDHWENDRAGRYKITLMYCIYTDLIPLEDGYRRLGEARNKLVSAPNALAQQGRSRSAAPIMINVGTQTADRHGTFVLPQGDINPEGRSRSRSFMETVLL